MKQLYNFAANQLHYVAKRLCSKMTGHYKLNLKKMLSGHIWLYSSSLLPTCRRHQMWSCFSQDGRAVIKRPGPGISPNYYEHLPRLLSKENERKIEPKEIPSCLIPCLLVVFTQQIEILVTTLRWPPTNHRNYKTLLVKLIVMFTAPALKWCVTSSTRNLHWKSFHQESWNVWWSLLISHYFSQL